MAFTDGTRPCFAFQRGKCKYGAKCKYEHTKNSSAPKLKPCEHFAKNRCNRGAACKFSHDPDDIAAFKARAPDPECNQEKQSTEAEFRRWRYNIPEEPSEMRKLGSDVNGFWQKAYQLTTGDLSVRQQVIDLFASAGGLKRIEELLDQTSSDLTDPQLERIFTARLLPFFQMLTNPDVCDSPLLQSKFGTILNYIYGFGGQRAVSTFTAVARHLSSLMLTLPSKDVHEDNILAFECSVVLFDKVTKLNTPSQVHKGLAPIANSISALVEDTPSDHLTFALRKTKEHLGRLNTRLKIGQDRPQMAGEAPKQGPVPTFKVSKDGPGIQSEDGPRHDNDNIDIREISILPTLQEIQSSRIEYLPSADPHDWHVVGLGGLLDRNFRLLREDTVGQLRDAAKFELERLQHPRRQADIQRRHQGPRCNVYENAKLQDIAFDPRAAMEIVLRFGQPHVLHSKSERQRRDWWEASKRLAAESLLCLLGSDGTAIFFTVAQEPRDFKHKDAELERARGRLHNNYDLYSDPLYAHVIVQLVTQDDSRTFFKRLIGNHNTRFSIVEFSGVLLASFLPTLQSMQHMSSSLDLPFAGIIAPVSTSADPNQVVEVPLPAYATRPGFTFNLSGLTTDGTDVRLLPGKRIAETVEELQAHTTLDAGQAEALASSLSRSLALIQGPPGTGKSHTGLQILRSLLANKANIKMGPILCVTFTNHALDQVLERSLDNGITQIVRIGGRSKSERLAELNLRVVAKQQELTKTEKSDRWGLMKQIEAEAKEINHILGDFEGIHADRQPQLEAYLLANHPEHHKQLFGEADEDGWERVNRHKRSVIENWLTLGPRNQSEPRTLDELHDVHVNDMFRRERERLYGSWVADMKLEVLFRLKTAMKAYHKNKAELDLIRTEVDLRVLKQADIVGVTTSGLARNIDLLRRSNAKVLVCEEAGEVLEAHQLTALLPSIEHAILIGDHQQLRPHVQNYDLSVESKSGAAYALDISLFERLVQPSNLLASPLPLSKLDIQRRMHPWISEFPTLIYPDLKDAATVSNYPEVPGLKHRLFWLDHERLENGDTDAQTTSRTNDYECDMVAGLVSHLVKQGVYSAGDIAVITPYLGQLRKIRNKLSSSFEILLNGRDQDELAQEGGEDGVPETTDESAPRNQVARGTLLSALRVATVDNFQGEEAKVVVVSLVRSNDAGRAGFLKTSNRINVLLSRAQHGMYLVGNGRTMETVPMWREVLDIFRAKNLIGGALELCCPRHPETPLFVKEPDDFIRVAPEAGCDRICNDRLPCGHRDASKCHSELLHQAVFCLVSCRLIVCPRYQLTSLSHQEPCNRPPPGCSVHVCPDPCGAACPKECTAPMNDVSVTPPNCDHEHTSLPCYQVRDPSRIVCEVMVTRTVEACGHVVNVPCHVDVNGPAFLCDAKCGANLEGCGHMCRKKCYNCRKSVNGEVVVDHGTCNQVCGRKFTTCSHSDRKACHGAEGCKPCKAKCEVACSHSACSRACWESCVPVRSPSSFSCSNRLLTFASVLSPTAALPDARCPAPPRVTRFRFRTAARRYWRAAASAPAWPARHALHKSSVRNAALRRTWSSPRITSSSRPTARSIWTRSLASSRLADTSSPSRAWTASWTWPNSTRSIR